LSQPLGRFFARTVKPFFLFTGAGTALVSLYAFFPSWVMPNVQYSFVSGFWVPFALDATVVLYAIGFFLTFGFRSPETGGESTVPTN